MSVLLCYSMKLTFPCAACETTVRAEIDPDGEESRQIACSECGRAIEVPADAVHDGKLDRCPVCPSRDLFIRKDFPQQLGVTIVAIGLGLSCVPWYFQWWYGTYAILFATALIDLVLYFTMGNLLECYRCHAQIRGVDIREEHEKFDLETFERYRQQEARLKQHEPQASSRA